MRLKTIIDEYAEIFHEFNGAFLSLYGRFGIYPQPQDIIASLKAIQTETFSISPTDIEKELELESSHEDKQIRLAYVRKYFPSQGYDAYPNFDEYKKSKLAKIEDSVKNHYGDEDGQEILRRLGSIMDILHEHEDRVKEIVAKRTAPHTPRHRAGRRCAR